MPTDFMRQSAAVLYVSKKIEDSGRSGSTDPVELARLIDARMSEMAEIDNILTTTHRQTVQALRSLTRYGFSKDHWSTKMVQEYQNMLRKAYEQNLGIGSPTW